MASAMPEGQTSTLKSDTGLEKTPESTSRCNSPGSPIGDDACPICLGQITDKCVAGSCLHTFCLICLKEWAKQKPVCPLCKLSFDKILYNIKSETDYKEWKVPPKIPAPSNISAFQEYFASDTRPFFGYRTTNFPGASRLRRDINTNANRLQRSIIDMNTDVIPSGINPRRIMRIMPHVYSHRGSSMYRLSVYLNELWVQPVSDVTGLFRESSPELYREQPALTHRLVPWVNRELAALLPPARISVVLTHIMELIERYPIGSREFRRELMPEFGNRTVHFIHEFECFARSPYDMVGHDNASHYIPRYNVNGNDDSDSSNHADDEIIEVSSNGYPINSEPLDLSLYRNNFQPLGVAREETLTNDGSVVISSDDELGNTMHDLSETHNPEPPSLHDLESSSNGLAAANRSDSDEMPLAVAGPSGISNNIANHCYVKEEHDSDSDFFTDECMVVDILKAKQDRTPEIINLCSESDNEEIPHSHWKKKMSREAIKEGKRKAPKIDRTSFSLHYFETLRGRASESNSTDLDAPSNQQDHHYACTKERSSHYNINSNKEPSTSFGKGTKKKYTKSEKHQKKYSKSSHSDNNSYRRKVRRISSSSSSSSSPATKSSRTSPSPSPVRKSSKTSNQSGTKRYTEPSKEKYSGNSKRSLQSTSSSQRKDYKRSYIRDHNRYRNATSSQSTSKRDTNYRHLKKWVCKKKKLCYYYSSDESGDTSSSSTVSHSLTSSNGSSISTKSSSRWNNRSSSCSSTSSSDSCTSNHSSVRKKRPSKVRKVSLVYNKVKGKHSDSEYRSSNYSSGKTSSKNRDCYKVSKSKSCSKKYRDRNFFLHSP